ncbi:Endonuclease/exonuclease/phosphatase domain-containing protein [Dioscorea alata]|uniref:Endonuclease/exonuclease/phosphatase domain-containing protein n=1 Tax=Dioscorea alata TaxID=55571 RepID=A0ACB7VMZ0_DIOAL|nr:Endonuclease/exonuclease/phosphatase domain-containing protein [Dioscorea alata]
MDGLIEPQRIHIGSDLLEDAISGDVKALASLLPVHDAAEAEAKAAVHEHNSDRTVLVIPKTATHESRNEIIFEVTGGGEAEAEAAAHKHNNDSTVPVIPTTATHESRNEIIFGVTGGGCKIVYGFVRINKCDHRNHSSSFSAKVSNLTSRKVSKKITIY